MPILKALSDLGRRPKVLLLGSGGLSIGQAGEFDYSGTQAVRSLLEEGIEVVVVNPNIATVQTNPVDGVRIYLYPVTPEWVERVIESEKPDAIMGGFGGQTALNCVVTLGNRGVLERYGVLNLGTSLQTLELTEDRGLFAAKMRSIEVPIAQSIAVSTPDEAVEAASQIGYPVILRSAYALGGLGSGFAAGPAELAALASTALAHSPQVLIEKSLKGWKEIEYEVMRDRQGNRIAICNMENFDPLGIHTGDSIVVTPSQTLTDEEHQTLRSAALRIVEALEIVGECNVQFALHPESTEFCVIEVNARLSRSSALASKATGYPIAAIAAKVVLGYDLLELKNPVTGVTCALFEPALDYVAVKIPRWDLKKFRGASRHIGSTMKSVGEVMGLGRTFLEAFQKAVRMVTEHNQGLSRPQADRAAMSPDALRANLKDALEKPTDARIFALVQAFRVGFSLDEVYGLTGIDRWFLRHLEVFCETEAEISAFAQRGLDTTLNQIQAGHWHAWKKLGFGDEQIAAVLLRALARDPTHDSTVGVEDASLSVRRARLSAGVRPNVRKIDTTAGEHPSPNTNYLYLSYGGSSDDVVSAPPSGSTAVILGGGSYRIGSSVEFDWCAVACSAYLRKAGWTSIIINCNPETVSTDFDSSNRLYFEELTLERILDVTEIEHPTGVIASMGGQLPNRLALPLAAAGIRLLGHSPETIDLSEDRSKFSAILDRLGIDQPAWTATYSIGDARAFAEKVGYPVLVRPSYVLSGAAMNVAYDAASLTECLSLAAILSPSHPAVLTKFIEGAAEVELDGVARHGEVITSIVSSHLENAGVHSGDATVVIPPQGLAPGVSDQLKAIGVAIARELRLNGPFNLQALVRGEHIRVIECNSRAARSFPFISKVTRVNLADLSTQAIINSEVLAPRDLENSIYSGVKAPMFSFTRLPGVDPVLGVEMASTGEVGCIARHPTEALLLALEASGLPAPRRGILVSSIGSQHAELRGALRTLHRIKVPIYESEDPAEALKIIRGGRVDLVINIAGANSNRDRQVRETAVRFGCSLLTNPERTTAFLKALGWAGESARPQELHRLEAWLS